MIIKLVVRRPNAMRGKRSHPPETAFNPYGIGYNPKAKKYLSIAGYSRKYNVPRSTVYHFLKKRVLCGVYQKGKYAVEDVNPVLVYKNNCYYPPLTANKE